MSTRRLLATVTVMAVIAAALAVLAPPPASMAAAVTAAQRTVDTQGPDVLIAAAAGLLAWAVWAWGAVGLALTAASALPGVLGGAARLALTVALPAAARRRAALVLGIGLGLAGPLTTSVLPVPSAVAWADDSTTVPDWTTPPAGPAAVPDWPAGTGTPAPEPPPAADRLVVRGDCLWHIAADSLLGTLRRLPTNTEIAVAVDAWWRANADVIGPDPDLLLPGQLLRAP